MASGPITLWQIEGEKVETAAELYASTMKAEKGGHLYQFEALIKM